jgi:biopolymer transport protein ExbD
MQFAPPRRKNAPSVIIISLIDVLIVVLIFLIVTTTVRQQPAIKLALPESKQQKAGAKENNLVIYIPKSGPIYLKKDPVTVDQLQHALSEAAQHDPEVAVSISADTEAPFGQIVKVMDAAKAAHVHNMSAFTKGEPAK